MEDSREEVTNIWELIDLTEDIHPGFKERYFHYMIHYDLYFGNRAPFFNHKIIA